jgi:leucyl/phenylalanyl-tRNA--protein transferase
MQKAYHELHALGLAHSCETWDPEGNLVGGLYGVSIGGTFAGESMFHREADASKLALLHLIDHLRARGLDWIDIQVMTPHMERLGARLIPRDEFLEKLALTQRRGLALF